MEALGHLSLGGCQEDRTFDAVPWHFATSIFRGPRRGPWQQLAVPGRLPHDPVLARVRGVGGHEADRTAPRAMSWPGNCPLSSFQPTGNCWKSRISFQGRNPVAAFEKASGLSFFFFFFSLSDIVTMTSSGKLWGFFSFRGNHKLLGCSTFSFRETRDGAITPVGTLASSLFSGPECARAHTHEPWFLPHLRSRFGFLGYIFT